MPDIGKKRLNKLNGMAAMFKQEKCSKMYKPEKHSFYLFIPFNGTNADIF